MSSFHVFICHFDQREKSVCFQPATRFKISPAGRNDKKVRLFTNSSEMGFIKNTFELLSILTDWVVIGAGIVFLFLAFHSIDVGLVRLLVAAIGVVFIACGAWFCYRRKTR